MQRAPLYVADMKCYIMNWSMIPRGAYAQSQASKQANQPTHKLDTLFGEKKKISFQLHVWIIGATWEREIT